MISPHHHHHHHKTTTVADLDLATRIHPDAMLDTKAVAALLGVSTQWLEVGRAKNYGPPWRKIGPKLVRYRGSDAIKWLNSQKPSAAAGRK